MYLYWCVNVCLCVHRPTISAEGFLIVLCVILAGEGQGERLALGSIVEVCMGM